MYHWMSSLTGELHENFRGVISEVFKTLAYEMKSHGTWKLSEILRFCVCWKYSRRGF